VNPILSALAESFTGSKPPVLDEPTSVQELLESLEALQEERWTFPQALDATDRLLDQARQSLASALEFVTANPQFCGEYRALLDQLIAGYGRGVEALEALREELWENRLSAPTLTELGSCRNQSRQDYQAVSEWMARAVARCPRCGAPGEYCQECSLEGLIPDRQARPSADPEAMTPAMLALYQAATAVSAGIASAETLGEPLATLHEEITLGARRVQAMPDSPRRSQLLEHAEAMLEGLERMETLFDHRMLETLHQGWDQVYRHHCAILELLAPD
jgi:hypothetical protein